MNAARSKTMRIPASWLWATWLLLFAVWTLALVTKYPAELEKELVPPEHIFRASKLLHLCMYAFLTFSSGFLTKRRGVRWLLVLVLSVHGFATEYIQTLVPGRDGNLLDVAIDHAGILLGLLLTWRWRARG